MAKTAFTTITFATPRADGPRSRFRPDGKYVMGNPRARTVAELVHLLKQLPGSLPLNTFDGGVELTWFNVGEGTEHVSIDACDGDNDEWD